jgi:hypothetical protein
VVNASDASRGVVPCPAKLEVGGGSPGPPPGTAARSRGSPPARQSNRRRPAPVAFRHR